MKFGKSIRREMHNNAGMHYINYKILKKQIKSINKSRNCEHVEERKRLSEEFEKKLHYDLRTIEETFKKFINDIVNIKKDIQRILTCGIIHNEHTIIEKKDITFDMLLDLLKENGDVSQEIFDFCVQLSILSYKCKNIRTYIIYNYVGLVKILKKRRKVRNNQALHADSGDVADPAYNDSDVLYAYSWCHSEELAQLVSSVNTWSDEFMQKFSNSPVTSEKYICPICLCLMHDPITLNSCFHSFCWKCLATAIQQFSIDNCPLCRTKIAYDKNTFKVDGILNHFLKKHFAGKAVNVGNEENAAKGGEAMAIVAAVEAEGVASSSMGDLITKSHFHSEGEKIDMENTEEVDTHRKFCRVDGEKNSLFVLTPSLPCDPSWCPQPGDHDKRTYHTGRESHYSDNEKINGYTILGTNLEEVECNNGKETNLETLRKYLTVLNKDDISMAQDGERESDYSDDSSRNSSVSCAVGGHNQKEIIKDEFSVISRVINYTLN
ncbi:RING zinc finger protein, putative [Plasmodium ovale wallikeri]|uniref:RING zinc finger protein, putative n=2 Tax=Plasmodium ovale TaxID=36330 RepID=A0A1A8YLK3_PLAOA|nr:RING zinc finger protein, putative [Plasmodium ovale wallikeri]